MISRFREILVLILFVLLQTLVVDHIRLFGTVTPFVYIFALLKLRINISRSVLIVISFLLGLVIDIFSNTYGMHAAACSFIGYIRKPLLDSFVDMKDIPDRSAPSYQLFGFGKFLRYALIIVSIHHVILFTIDAFGFHQPVLLIIRLISCILFTSLLIFIIESFYPGKIKHGE